MRAANVTHHIDATHYRVGHPVQGIMSRTGSFPLALAQGLIGQYAGPRDVVFDPFCGKGTSLLAARTLGRPAFGMDIAPEAVVCTLAKMVDVDIEGVSGYIQSLPANAESPAVAPARVQTFFHPATLDQILAIRHKLSADVGDLSDVTCSHRPNAVFTLALLLGILHGHASYSLSIQSAHAYSMSPAYVARFAEIHGLVPPLRDVRVCLLKKAATCLSAPLPKPVTFAVRRGTAVRCTSVFDDLTGKVDLILTSPPYLSAQTYAKDNWLRLWFLGYEYKSIQRDYIETSSVRRYEDHMVKVLCELRRMLKPGGRLICVAGDVPWTGGPVACAVDGVFHTGTFLQELSETSKVGFRIERSDVNEVPSGRRYFHSLSNSNGHTKRNMVERVFVAVKPTE